MGLILSAVLIYWAIIVAGVIVAWRWLAPERWRRVVAVVTALIFFDRLADCLGGLASRLVVPRKICARQRLFEWLSCRLRTNAGRRFLRRYFGDFWPQRQLGSCVCLAG